MSQAAVYFQKKGDNFLQRVLAAQDKEVVFRMLKSLVTKSRTLFAAGMSPLAGFAKRLRRFAIQTVVSTIASAVNR